MVNFTANFFLNFCKLDYPEDVIYKLVSMIVLTKIDGTQIVVNADEIETIDPFHHSTLSLKSGKKIIVTENANEIIEKIIEYKRKCFSEILLKIPQIKDNE